MPSVHAAIGGGDVTVPYLLADMADDAVGLLDHLGVDRAHVFGVSMGGMIAQTIAIEHPERVASLISVMSTTGDPDVGAPTGEAIAALMSPPATTRDEYMDVVVHHAHVWGSPACSTRTACATRPAVPGTAATTRRAPPASSPPSWRRAAGRPTWRQLAVPTLVIHGTADKLVQPSGGERTAEVIPDAKLLVVEGMGHDLAPPLWPRLIDAVTGHAAEHP